MRRLLLIAAVLGAASCGEDNVDVSLTDDWGATVNALGITTVTLSIVETSNTLTATGQWVPVGSTTPRPVTANGLHFVSGINMVLTFDTETGPAVFTTQGQVENANSFYLLFPVGDNPTKVNFTRR